jgi:hypothetical protein
MLRRRARIFRYAAQQATAARIVHSAAVKQRRRLWCNSQKKMPNVSS